MTLGKSAKVHRLKATSEDFFGEGPVAIDTAYRELSHHAFSIWIRLMVATDDELRVGRRALAKFLGYGQHRSNAVLLELKHKGYVSWIVRPGLPSEVVVMRRAKLPARSRFIRIS